MTLKEIREMCVSCKLAINQLRHVSDNYEELVFYTQDTDKWIIVLSEFFDPPVKPCGEEPTSQQEKLAKDFGGIYDEQTMFHKVDGKSTVIALFWPWRDGVHTTLKMAMVKK